MRFRLLRRLTVAAPKVTVRTHVPAAVRVAVALIAMFAAAAGGFALARYGFARDAIDVTVSEVGRLTEENRVLRAEHDRVLETSNTTDSRRLMEGSTIRELGAQIAKLEADNTRLKEDVAFFEAATADRPVMGVADAGGIAIRRFQVTQDKAVHGARYRILLTQDAKAKADFSGRLQLSVSYLQGGRPVTIALPENSGAAPAAPSSGLDAAGYNVVFRSYKRIDGVFDLPADAVLKSVQVRIVERGAVRAQQTVTVAS